MDYASRIVRRLCASVLLVTPVAVVGAQDATEVTREVTAGPEYQAGAFHRFWLGTNYRPLWTTPIQVPVLDLARFAGGLTPVRQVGQMQTAALALRGADGRAYTFRSLHKEPERVLPEDWRDRWPGTVMRDQTCATHPAAAVILPVLAEAAGVAHTSPRLVVMPDDPRLGHFREKFAGQLGTIDEFPTPAADDYAGFMGATSIVSSQELWTLWLDSPENRVDTRAYLRARILDLFVENFDRHRGQWRWASVPGKPLLQPVPEDPDMAFIRHEGLTLAMLRPRFPKLVDFSGSFPRRLDGPTLNGSELDRWILTDLTLADFDEVARDVQAGVTDEVIEQAARQMPPEWFALDGPRLIHDLESRRDDLVGYVHRYYDHLADEVDVHATDRDEHAVIEHRPDGGVEIRVALTESPDEPYYRRLFDPRETKEIRLYVHGGRNHVFTVGTPIATGRMCLRVVTAGDTTVDDRIVGHTDVWRDEGTLETVRGPGTKVRTSAWLNPKPVEDAPWLEPRNWGSWHAFAPFAWAGPDIELLVGGTAAKTTWGFRSLHYARRQTLSVAWSTGLMDGKAEYVGVFRRSASSLAARLEAFGSQIEHPHFFGFGNETPEETDRHRYRSRQSVVRVRPHLLFEREDHVKAFVGPAIEWSNTPVDVDTVLAAVAPYGAGRFGHIAVAAGLSLDSREDGTREGGDAAEGFLDAAAIERTTGVRLAAQASVTPPIWDAHSTFGAVEAEATGHLGTRSVILATRVGGRHAMGDYPWFESAFIGGRNNRGYRIRRFAGDTSLYANGELRAWLGSLGTPLTSLRVGAFGLVDVGRVWYEDEGSSEWHTSYGGGLLLQPLELPATLHVTVATGGAQTRVYFGSGYSF